MPHKRNPIGCENVSGLARLVARLRQAALEDIPLWHERDISHSSVERVMLPDATTLCDSMLHRMTGILDGLHVYPERMAENMGRMKGLVFSQAVLLALASAGLSREAAYEIVQRVAMAVWAGEGLVSGSARRRSRASPRRFRRRRLRRASTPTQSLKHVDAIYARAFGAD
mgnify:CR=1 FL=1